MKSWKFSQEIGIWKWHITVKEWTDQKKENIKKPVVKSKMWITISSKNTSISLRIINNIVKNPHHSHTNLTENSLVKTYVFLYPLWMMVQSLFLISYLHCLCQATYDKRTHTVHLWMGYLFVPHPVTSLQKV